MIEAGSGTTFPAPIVIVPSDVVNGIETPWLSEIRVPFGAVLMSNGMIEAGTIPEAALASTVKEISPRPKLLPGFSVVNVPGVATVSNPCRSLVGGGGGGLMVRLPPNNESAMLLPAKIYEPAVVDVVALVNRTPDPPGTWSSNWKPATLNDWVLVEGLSRSSSRVPAKPGGTVTFVLAGTTSTTSKSARAVRGCPMAPSSTNAAAIAPRGESRRGRTGNLEEGRTRVRIRITARMV